MEEGARMDLNLATEPAGRVDGHQDARAGCAAAHFEDVVCSGRARAHHQSRTPAEAKVVKTPSRLEERRKALQRMRAEAVAQEVQGPLVTDIHIVRGGKVGTKISSNAEHRYENHSR